MIRLSLALVASAVLLTTGCNKDATQPQPEQTTPQTPVELKGKGPFQKSFFFSIYTKPNLTGHTIEQADEVINKWVSDNADKKILRRHLAQSTNSMVTFTLEYEFVEKK